MMISHKLIWQAVSAQIVIFGWILLKLFLLPYIIWTLFGTAHAAVTVGDLSVIGLGTLASLSLGIIGYYHAQAFTAARSPMRIALLSMLIVHAPLFIYLGCNWLFTTAWQLQIQSLFSGWISIVSHPMILVGIFGKPAELLGAFIMCSSYLLGVWVYFDEYQAVTHKRVRMK